MRPEIEAVDKPDMKDVIKAEIENVFGRKIISSRDCIHLSDEVFNKTRYRLNPNTLRRFFGVVKSKYPPSRATLNILCSYCGFRSIDELKALKAHAKSDSDCIQAESMLHYFVTLFNELPVADDRDKIFYTMVKHTILFLNRNVMLIEKFQRLIVKTKNGNKYYFERFVNIDSLDAYYGDGLRYYLTENETPEAQTFGHTLLVFRYWLTQNNQKLEWHYNEVMKYRPDRSAQPHIHAFHFASSLFHAHANTLPPVAIITEIYHYHSTSISDPLISFAYESIVGQALILTGNYEEGLFYTNYQLRKLEDRGKTEDYILQGIYLFNAIALYKTNNLTNAAKILRKIRPSQFHFLTTKYQTILYGILMGKIKRKTTDYQDQTDALIRQTGFVRISTLFN